MRLNSQPCSQVSHQKPDIPVGPTVDDFVDAVTTHRLIDTTAPRPVELGDYSGTFFSMLGPSDLSECYEWRPWEPAPFVQGPANRWDLWVMDVDGVRVVIMTQYFPETPAAIKAELRSDPFGERVRMTVCDTGIGIAADDLARLARPFEQIESQHAKTQQGTGLGLALTKSLVELHGGAVDIASAPGEGTTVAFSIPVRQSQHVSSGVSAA